MNYFQNMMNQVEVTPPQVNTAIPESKEISTEPNQNVLDSQVGVVEDVMGAGDKK